MSVYGVAGLPTGLSKASAKEILDELFDTETQTIVRSLGLHPNTDSLVATVMFIPVPSPLLDRQSWKFDKVLSCGGQVRRVQLEIDTAFLGFTPLNIVEDTQDRRIDCVVVSGLSSHPFGSWKERGGEFMWLVDDDTAFPSNVRVLLYGYDTSLLGSESFQNVADIGERLAISVRSVRPFDTTLTQFEPRPIVFIAHSLGGLVVKEAISNLAKKDASNAKCICGLVFFGVPHQGLLVKPWLNLIKEQPNRQLVENLKPESPYLKRLDKNFKDAITFKDLKVVSIYETMTTQTTQKDSSGAVGRTGDREVLVPISSALGHWPESVSPGRVAINRTHDNLPKFRGRFDEDYQTVKHCLQDIWATAVEDVQKRFAADEKPTNSNAHPVKEKKPEVLPEKEVPLGLMPLWPSPEIEEVANIPTEVDLIAIHGLGGHAIKTWTCGERLWLRDFLPSDFPQVRVLTFGFDGSEVFSACKSNIHSIATQLLFGIKQLRRSKNESADRKLIFVCHGFGGVIFKQAMVMACESESRYSGLANCVAGVLFLGTPQKKTDIGYWTNLLAKAALLHDLQQNLLFNLEERATELGSICSGFVERGMPAGLQVFSLFEQRITEKLGSPVVEESSAILHLTAETPLPLNADHENMSRYLTESSLNYRTVSSCIAELVDTLSGKAEHTFFNSSQRDFLSELRAIDTEKVLSLIPVHLNKPSMWLLEHPEFQSWSRPQGRQITWLHGSPGSGKTVLMRGIVAYLKEKSGSSRDAVIRKPLYFFFDDKDSTRKTSAAFVRSILSQILVDERTSYLIKYLEGRDYTKDAGMEDNLWICLSTVINRSRGIMFQFVIDAIDEVLRSSDGATPTILDRLEELITQDLSGRVKLMLSNRKTPQNELGTDMGIIDIDNDSNRQNVQAFVHRQIRKHLQRSLISVSIGDDVENRIMEISRGNFLHARLAWDQFYQGITKWSRDEIQTSLDQLTTISHGLVAAYCKLLSSIPRVHQSKAKASFAILRISRAKLTSRQLAFFATLHDQTLEKRPSPWSEIQSQSDDFEDYLSEACGYVIRRAHDGSVDFTHVSAKDLFTDSMKGLSPEEQQVISHFAVSDADAHAMMHTLCLSIFRLENRQAEYWSQVLNDLNQAREKVRKSFGKRLITREEAAELAEAAATCLEVSSRTPCFAYALRHYISHYEAAKSSSHADSALVSFMSSRQAYYCHRMWLAIRSINDTEVNFPRSPSVLVEGAEDMNSFDLSRSAALFRVMARGDCPRIVKGLVAQGANVNHVAGSKQKRVTPLSWAIIYRRKDSFCTLLRDVHVDVNLCPNSNSGPLHFAARCVDDLFYIQRLMDHPDTDVNNLGGFRTPLHDAFEFENMSGVEALLAHPDIDLSIQDKRRETPYLKAFKHKMWEPLLMRMMKMVSQATWSTAISGTSQLLVAGIHGWTHVEECILKAIPDQVLMQDPDTKMNALARYAFFGRREKLLWIMDRLPNQLISLRSDVDHYDLLHLCAHQNWEDIVLMMQRKYHLQSLPSDHVGRTLLHWALEYNWDIDVIDFSQYSMADINKQDRDGLTAVHLAVTNRNMAALEVLVASGASCLQKDKTGMSPAHMAADQGYRAALEYFINIPNADFGTTRTGASLLHLIAMWFDGAMIRRFVNSRKAALDINAVDHERRTALHYAAMANNLSAADTLVALGCSINGRDNNGKSPIHEAIRGDGADVALHLLHLGADWRATDAFGQTCLHLSLRYRSDSLVSRFLRLGIDIDAVDGFGMTPLHRACGAGNVDHARELLRKGAAWDVRNIYRRSPLELAVEARTKSTVDIMVSWVLMLRRAKMSGRRRSVMRYLDRALKLACELELERKSIGIILKEAGADIDYSKVKIKRVYRVGPIAEPGRDALATYVLPKPVPIASDPRYSSYFSRREGYGSSYWDWNDPGSH